MPKGKKFTAAEKHFSKKIEERDKTIKYLRTRNEELLDEKYLLLKENEDLKFKLDYANKALEELSKLNDLSPEDTKALVDRATNINEALNILGITKHLGMY